MDRTTGDRLGPGDAVPNNSKSSQIWDPTLGAFRAQRLPIALSKSSIAANALNGTATKAQLPRPSIPSYTSLPRSFDVSATNYTYSSAQSLPPSLISQPSSNSVQTKPRATVTSRAGFKSLPPEVYDCILQQLRILHEAPEARSCQTCHLQDLCSLSLTSRAWDKAAQKRMYDRIHILGHDSKDGIKKYKMKTGVRLKLLRRTLRERSFLAQLVRELKVPRIHTEGDPVSNDMINSVASLVMACPNLERLVGFYVVYGHEFDRLTHALSTRRKLKEHVWLIGENTAITQRSYRQLAPGLMDPEQKSSFVSFHSAWSSLTTLVIHSPSQGILEKDVFINLKNDEPRKVRGPGVLQRLPALQRLCISNFDCDDFDDKILQHLPPLQSLRLQELEGVTFWGLSEFSRTRHAVSLRNLSLVHLDIKYISAISNLLLHLKNLKRFTLVQDTSPEVAEGEIVIQPIIASHTLEFIHWDILVLGSANTNLAKSIKAKGFPKLRTIRAPSDHEGLLQALCKPRAQIELPGDWETVTKCGQGLPADSLQLARQAAQQRIEEAWNTVEFRVVVEESGVVNEIFDLNGFVGATGSEIYYSLEPDIPGNDTALIDFPDLVSGKDERDTKDACKGSWKSSRPGDWHTERPRYRPMDLQRLF